MAYKENNFPNIVSTQDQYLETVKLCTKRAAQIAESCTIPICDCSDEYNQHVIGTGVLIEYNSRNYLVTASHVIPDGDNTRYDIPTDSGLRAIIGPALRLKSKSDEDRHDLLILELNEELVSQMSQKKALKIKNTDVQKTYGFDENVAIVGFPTSKNRKHRKYIKKFYTQVTMDRTAQREAYKNENYSINDNILINFDRENYVTQNIATTTHPDPHGMSGGGVWRLFGQVDRFSPREPYLIGILIEKTKSEKYFVAVKLGYVIDALRKFETCYK